MNRIILLVGLGGFLGSIARYVMAVAFTRMFPSPFPYGTFVVNIMGCFLIGVFYGLSERYGWFSAEWKFFLITGLCGGYTTFSSFAYENVILLQKEAYFTFALYTIGSLALGLMAVIAGVLVTKVAALF